MNICHNCGGACYVVVVRDAQIAGKDMTLAERVPCPTCDGSGRVVEFG
jgi:DnaJ-class molecular chaperone